MPYPLHNATNIQTIHSASQSYYNSFLSSVIRDWNDLSEEVRNSAIISTFKCKLNSNIKSPPKYYFRGTRIGQNKKIINDQELIQSDPTSCPQNRKGNN